MDIPKVFEKHTGNIVLALTLLLSSNNTRGSTSVCMESFSTIQNVDHCPITAEEWAFASRKKRCDAIARLQKCTNETEKFVYHCIVNENKNGFVEVCAPIWILTGYCGFYDRVNGRIYNDVSKDCTTVEKSPCPKRFNSSLIYKYSTCYDITKKNNIKGENQSFTGQHLPWIVSNVIISAITLISIITITLLLAIAFRRFNTRNVQNQAEARNADSHVSIPLNVQNQAEARNADSHVSIPLNGNQVPEVSEENEPFLSRYSSQIQIFDEEAPRTSSRLTSRNIIDRAKDSQRRRSTRQNGEEEEEEVVDERVSTSTQVKSEVVQRPRPENIKRSYSIPAFDKDSNEKKKRKRKKRKR